MKAPIFITFLLLAAVTAVALEPDDTPFITRKIAKLKTAITDEVSAGQLSRDDAGKYTARIAAIEKEVADATSLSNNERQILRGQLAEIAKELGAADQSDSQDEGFFGKAPASPSP